MSHFLWVEDFETSPEVTADNVFGDLFGNKPFSDDERELKRYIENYGVSVELNLQDGLEAITPDLDKKFDYIILDIDLPAYDGDLNQEVLGLLSEFEGYQTLDDEAEDEALRKQACHSLKSIAGFYLYTKLVVELGFPKQHILFCSNHGENTETIQNAFKAAKIKLPKIYQKSDVEVKSWVKDRYENPYSRLRRGVIEGCRYLINKPLRFSEYNSDNKKQEYLDLENYLAILSGFFSLTEPEAPSLAYKLFIRTLAHEWDDAVRPKNLGDSKVDKQVSLAFSWIMKMTRNWSAHSKVFEELSAQDVAFLFIVNMRAMFYLGGELVPYERYLLTLFESPLEVEDFKTIYGSDFKTRQIPLTPSYAWMLHKYGPTFEAINFHDLLNEVQKKSSESNQFLIKGLYQVFWFLTSFGRIYIDPYKIQEQKFINYQFDYFDYGAEVYLAEIGRHIYQRSFSET
jgi:hypothetical protein